MGDNPNYRISFSRIWKGNVRFFEQPALAAATPESQLRKLRAELDELEVDHSVEEAADVMVCLIGFLIKKDYTIFDFLMALAKKTRINLARKWQLQNDGTYQHIKER
jgi:hypothetical protein